MRARVGLAVLAAVLASASATATPLFVVALGKTVELPEGWKVAEDAGQRGMAFDVPTGERVEIAVWKPQLSAGEVLDAKHVAWEHLILLRRSCNFRPESEERVSTPLAPRSVRVAGRADIDGKVWTGAFVACVLDGGRACVIGCFAAADRGAPRAFALLDELAAAAAGVVPSPTPALVAGRPGSTPDSGKPSLGSETPVVGGGGAASVVPGAPPVASPGGELLSGRPERTSESAASPQLAASEDTRPPVAEELALAALRYPTGALPEVELAAAAPGYPERTAALEVLAQVAALGASSPNVPEALAPEALRLPAGLFPEITLAGPASGHPERVAAATALPESAFTADTLPPLDTQLASTLPLLWQVPAPPTPSAELRPARPGATRIVLAPPVHPVEPSTGGASPALAAAISAAGALRVAVVSPKPAEKRWIVTAPLAPAGRSPSVAPSSSRPAEGLTVTALRPQPPRPALALRLASALPGLPPSAVLTSSSPPPLAQPAAVVTPERPHTVAERPAARPLGSVPASPHGGPLTSSSPPPAARPTPVVTPERPHTVAERPAAQPIRAVPGSAPAPVSSGVPGGLKPSASVTPERPKVPAARPTPGTLSAAPATSGPTVGWAVDAGMQALRVPAPPGWSLTVKVADGPGGPAILVQGQCVTEPSERIVWAQPGLPGYREFTQLLQAMGYREWQPYKDAAGNRTLTLVARRNPARFLEQTVLPESPAKLHTWQILDAQPSAAAADLVGGPDGLVAHVLAAGASGATEGWFSVATGTPAEQPSYLWVGAWLGAMAKPGDTRAVDALVQAICGAQVLDTPARTSLERALASAQAAARDLKRSAGRLSVR